MKLKLRARKYQFGKMGNRTVSRFQADNSLVVDGVNLTELTDDELFKMLKAEGVENVGPIVGKPIMTSQTLVYPLTSTFLSTL